MFKLKAAKLKEELWKSTKSLAKHSFLFFIILFLIIAFSGCFIFYCYQSGYFLSIEGELNGVKPLKFDTEKQQKVLEEWQKRNENFNSTSSHQYSDPFQVD
ncbi:MAG: hypothetical protein FJZ05_00310 [Candidatus Nealsonbacteria bacterium]|nr:hypothetical protein [Candidatus Nealsonbacteria bacterium]